MTRAALLLCLVSALASAQSDPEHERLYGALPAPRQDARSSASAADDDGSSWLSLDRWSVAHEDLGGGRHRLRFELSTLHTGGDGEVRARVVKWAESMVRRQGLAGYQIARMEEGVDSGWFFGQRYAEIEVQFIASATFGVF
ncbi:MAG: hypothetical protein KDG55_05095 [Rhodocyclaceae bacterium]|nr:hypothetical protein [Rhodocyclaceae bacterium]